MSETRTSEYKLNIEQIKRFLPHRAPFLLVDRILEIHPTGDLNDVAGDNKAGTKVIGIKNFTINEPFFQGHFPDYAIAPGVLLIEMMAQVASFSTYPYLRDFLERGDRTFQVFLAGVDNTRFRKPVTPGDTVRVETTVIKTRGKLWMFQCHAMVDGQKVAETELMANLVLLDRKGNPV